MPKLFPDPAVQRPGIDGFHRHGVVPEHLVDVVDADVRDRAHPAAQPARFADGRNPAGIGGQELADAALGDGRFDHGVADFEAQDIADHQLDPSATYRPG